MADSRNFTDLLQSTAYGHVSEDGPPTGWRCDIFPEKFKLKMITYTTHFGLILKLSSVSLI